MATKNPRLTKAQREAALALLAKRPAVLPGTRAILDRDAQRSWHDEVYQEMQRNGVVGSQDLTHVFCDVAGVAD